MSLRFLCDHCVPAEIVEALRRAGHGVTPLRELLAVNAPDASVIARAREIDVILISLNGDFADIVAYPPSQYRGIIAIQLHNHPEIIPDTMRRLTVFLAENPAQEFYHGKLLIAEAHRIRVRT